MKLTVSTPEPLPRSVQARLLSTLNSKGGKEWDAVPFERIDPRTLTCRIELNHPGLHSFRAEFSLDNGGAWLGDTAPDAWILVDPPQADGLRLYTMIPTVSGTLADWTADLKRIRDMGFNAIHLLPITALDTSESPYSARNLFDIDHSYLIAGSRSDGLAQLEDYITAARELDIRLCFDLVLNHIGVNSDMARRAPDWIAPDQNQPDGLKRARYWAGKEWFTWNDLVLINYEHPSEGIRSEIWTYMTDYALFWAKYADDTGGFVRFDNLHSSNRDFIQSATAAMHAEFPNVGIVAEYFTDEHTLLQTGPAWGLNLVLATPWNYGLAPQLRDYLTHIHSVSGQVRYYMPITSHDSGAPAQEFGAPESTIPRYVAAALLGTGSTGMPQGVEIGERKRIDFIGRKPKMAYPAVPRFARFIATVNAILATYPAFRRGENCQFVDNGHDAIIAAFRRDPGPESSGFLVVCNFDVLGSQRISIDLSFLTTAGPFRATELLTGEIIIFPGARVDLTLAPCAAKVLRLFRDGNASGGETT